MAESYIFPSDIDSAFAKNKLWVIFDVFEMKNQHQLYSTKGKLITENKQIKFKFLAPNSIIENTSHMWENQESTMSRAAQKFKTFGAATENAGNIASMVGKLASDLVTKGFSKERAEIVANMSLQGKVDAPLLYKDSQRREFNFNFEFMAFKGSTSIISCVRKIQELSSPGMDGFKTIYPYIFQITTEPGGILFVQNAALVNVQSTLHYPFLVAGANGENLEGEPTKCELALTFREIDPLYDISFTQESKEAAQTGGQQSPKITTSDKNSNNITNGIG